MEKPGLIVAYPPYGSLSDDEIETLAAVLRTTMLGSRFSFTAAANSSVGIVVNCVSPNRSVARQSARRAFFRSRHDRTHRCSRVNRKLLSARGA